MDLEPVRDAYSPMSEQYIGLFAGGRQDHEDVTTLVRQHLTRLPGPVLDLGCGPGHWTAYLHSSGTDVTGVDMVPEFIAHVRATHRGPEFRLGSMTEWTSRALRGQRRRLVLDDPPGRQRSSTGCSPSSGAS